MPKKFRFEGTEVYIKQVPEGVLLISKEKYDALIWQEWAENLAKFEEPIDIDRGGMPQQREGDAFANLDEIQLYTTGNASLNKDENVDGSMLAGTSISGS